MNRNRALPNTADYYINEHPSKCKNFGEGWMEYFLSMRMARTQSHSTLEIFHEILKKKRLCKKKGDVNSGVLQQYSAQSFHIKLLKLNDVIMIYKTCYSSHVL